VGSSVRSLHNSPLKKAHRVWVAEEREIDECKGWRARSGFESGRLSNQTECGSIKRAESGLQKAHLNHPSSAITLTRSLVAGAEIGKRFLQIEGESKDGFFQEYLLI